MNFFVAALPRSRTAWLSVFLGQSGRRCLHDGFNGCESLEDYRLKLGSGGDSSTGLHLFNISEMFPDAPIVVIEKSDSELESCIRWCDLTYGVDSRAEMIKQNELLSSIEGFRIKQSEIDLNLKSIFEYLTHSEWRPEFSTLSEFNIQADPYNIDVTAAGRLLSECL